MNLSAQNALNAHLWKDMTKKVVRFLNFDIATKSKIEILNISYRNIFGN